MTKYKQCRLERVIDRNPRVRNIQTAWLPIKHAIEGNIVDVKNHRLGTWSRGWTVKRVAGTTVGQTYVVKKRRRTKFASLQGE